MGWEKQLQVHNKAIFILLIEAASHIAQASLKLL